MKIGETKKYKNKVTGKVIKISRPRSAKPTRKA